jgi:hypothetical protein
MKVAVAIPFVGAAAYLLFLVLPYVRVLCHEARQRSRQDGGGGGGRRTGRARKKVAWLEQHDDERGALSSESLQVELDEAGDS